MIRTKTLVLIAVSLSFGLAGCGSQANPTNGRDGLATLVNVATEAPGAVCAHGGSRVEAGPDTNANGVLDADEVTSTSHVCTPADGLNGDDGRDGLKGDDGLDTLTSITVEPAGENCPTGGSKIEAGLDTNDNGVLEAGEVATTSYVCSGPGVLWVAVTTATQARPNTGYLVDGAAQIAITLPTEPAVGDIVRVSGLGDGGWKVTPNAGQSISTPGIASGIGVRWTEGDSDRYWQSVASSADGMRLAAAVRGGRLYTSTDAGVSWTARESNRYWYSVASSADGMRLVAAANSEQLYTSDDAGVTWTARETVRAWRAVASSSDGMRLVAAVFGGQLYTSSDAGANWTAHASVKSWSSVASSADGTRLVAAIRGGEIYTSSDAGANWTISHSSGIWTSVASSADGMRLVAAAENGKLYTSSDAGASWRAHESIRDWSAVASSSDGTRLLAGVFWGQLYTSSDAGVSWTARESSRNWRTVAVSADGSLGVAGASRIYTSRPGTSTGLTGAIIGKKSEAVELQYMGNGAFTVLSHSGTLQVE